MLCNHTSSESVVFTTVAVVYRVSTAAVQIRHSEPVAAVRSSSIAPVNTSLTERTNSCSTISAQHQTQWTPIANGALAQLHIFLELDRARAASEYASNNGRAIHSASPSSSSSTSSRRAARARFRSDETNDKMQRSGSPASAKRFRLVVWMLDTGNVVVNDALARGCAWDDVVDSGSDAVRRQFTTLDGTSVYGFGFATRAQALECSQFVHQILSASRAAAPSCATMLWDRNTAHATRRVVKHNRRHVQQQPQQPQQYDSNSTTATSPTDGVVVYPKASAPPRAVSTSESNNNNNNNAAADDDTTAQHPDACSSNDTTAQSQQPPPPLQLAQRRSGRRRLLTQFAAAEIAAMQQELLALSTTATDGTTHNEHVVLADAALEQALTDAIHDCCTVRDHDLHPTDDSVIDDDASLPLSPSLLVDDFLDCCVRHEHRPQSRVAIVPMQTQSPVVQSTALIASPSLTLMTSSSSSTRAMHSTNTTITSPPATAVVDRISFPFKTRQELHITYNAAFARYEGLPPAWQLLNQQFGMSLDAVPKRLVVGYAAKIPSVLQMLWTSLQAHRGLLVEGIFRVAPEKAACAAVKLAINSGTFNGCDDVHILANLIKVWFRELPQNLYNIVPVQHIYNVSTLTDPTAILAQLDDFPPLHRSALLWLLDVMADVVRDKETNKMTARNMAIVMSPNLFSIATDNPMYALTMSQTVTEYTLTLLNARLALTGASSLHSSTSSS